MNLTGYTAVMDLLHLICGGGRLCIHLALGNREHISFIQAPLCYFFYFFIFSSRLTFQKSYLPQSSKFTYQVLPLPRQIRWQFVLKVILSSNNTCTHVGLMGLTAVRKLILSRVAGLKGWMWCDSSATVRGATAGIPTSKCYRAGEVRPAAWWTPTSLMHYGFLFKGLPSSFREEILIRRERWFKTLNKQTLHLHDWINEPTLKDNTVFVLQRWKY